MGQDLLAAHDYEWPKITKKRLEILFEFAVQLLINTTPQKLHMTREQAESYIKGYLDAQAPYEY